MKKIVMLIAAAAFISFYACTEDEEKCEDCAFVEEDADGTVVTKDETEELCGSSLENAESDTVDIGGDHKGYYECQ